MKTEELDIIRDAVHNALEAVRCLGGLEKKSSMILISKNDLKTYLGGNLEGKLVEAYKILEAEASGESRNLKLNTAERKSKPPGLFFRSVKTGSSRILRYRFREWKAAFI
ncbi:hypothetical protein [uncultured Alistipes sp.]|uniref:hypothetical protein n=1 Tax=uncultured Alistipes sp. TaxID=538949 RepID=UPI00321F6F3B